MEELRKKVEEYEYLAMSALIMAVPAFLVFTRECCRHSDGKTVSVSVLIVHGGALLVSALAFIVAVWQGSKEEDLLCRLQLRARSGDRRPR